MTNFINPTAHLWWDLFHISSFYLCIGLLWPRYKLNVIPASESKEVLTYHFWISNAVTSQCVFALKRATDGDLHEGEGETEWCMSADVGLLGNNVKLWSAPLCCVTMLFHSVPGAFLCYRQIISCVRRYWHRSHLYLLGSSGSISRRHSSICISISNGSRSISIVCLLVLSFRYVENEE